MSTRALEKLQQRRRAARHRRLRRRTLGWVISVLVVLAGVGLLADRLMNPAVFQIRELAISGDFEHLDPQRLRDTVAAAVQGNYFAVDLKRVERAAESLDWVREARVRRVWPDGLRVRVAEQQLVARWGHDAWLNRQGEVVAMDAAGPVDLLRLAGPRGSAAEVWRQARQWAEALAAGGLELKALTLNERHAWYAVVARTGSGGIFSVALGRNSVPDRFDRFVKGYQALPAEKTARIDHVDARYPNGIAVRLKQVVNS